MKNDASKLLATILPWLGALLLLTTSGVAGQGGPVGVVTLEPYQQCGGNGGNCGATCLDGSFPDTTCLGGYTCCRQSESYRQCVPTESCTGTVTPETPQPASEVPPYAQCGGLGGTCADTGTCVDASFPGSSCSGGYTCCRQNEYYYQCLPKEQCA